jgi:hypothetical protein
MYLLETGLQRAVPGGCREYSAGLLPGNECWGVDEHGVGGPRSRRVVKGRATDGGGGEESVLKGSKIFPSVAASTASSAAWSRPRSTGSSCASAADAGREVVEPGDPCTGTFWPASKPCPPATRGVHDRGIPVGKPAAVRFQRSILRGAR